MSRDADEDVIEATIRRVAASKAAGQAQQSGGDADPEPAPSAAATNLIDATIRRIAASKAAGIAHEADGGIAAPPPVGDADPFEATIRRVAARSRQGFVAALIGFPSSLSAALKPAASLSAGPVPQ